VSALLEVRGLGKRYGAGAGALSVLAEVSFSVAAGASVAVVGPSGSGKSTLLGLLAGLDQPSAGSVLVEGRDLAAMPARERADFRGRRLGFVFQSFRLLPGLSAEENVRVPLELAGVADARARAARWLERVGLGARARHRPAELSGGEQQRVALARALAPGPALLLADEPTGNLDSRTGSAMAGLLFAAAREQGATLLIVTHDLALARRAGRIIALSDGRVESDRVVEAAADGAGQGAAPRARDDGGGGAGSGAAEG
jgi:putative ABC transport system ATP-binding protein